MIIRIGILLSLVFAAGGLHLAHAGENPTGPENSKILRSQSKAEELFSRGDYKRALFIYEKELARTGDKFAQYMAGYMYLMGHGTESDPVLASAWYRLAAERNAPEFVQVRDRLMKALSAEDRARSDTLYMALRKDLSDVAIVMNYLELERRRLDQSGTGTRLRGASSSARIMDPLTGQLVSFELYQKRTMKNMQTRLDFLTSSLDLEPLDANLSDREFAELRERVDEYLSQADNNGDAFADTR